MKEPAPVLLFVYNRPRHTRRTLESLRANSLAADSHLIIHADGPKAGEEKSAARVREICRERSWCGRVTLIEHEENRGLAASIVGGVRAELEKSTRVIVLEDDLELSPGFLAFMNDALELYADEERVMHVSGYMYPVKESLPETFFMPKPSSWGWATWRRAFGHFNGDAGALLESLRATGRLEEFDPGGIFLYERQLRANAEGRLKTWAVQWTASIFLNGGLSLFPGKSLVQNIGHDGSGEHCNATGRYRVKRLADQVNVNRIPLVEDTSARLALCRFLAKKPAGPIATIGLRLRRALHLSPGGLLS